MNTKRPYKLVLAALALAVGTVLSGPESAVAQSEAPAAGEGPSFLEIPYPDMEGLEEAVKEQINAAHGHLRSWQRRADAPAAELAAAFGRLGKILHAYELWEAAEACYLNASGLEPQRFDWLYLLGHVDQRRGRYEAAAGHYQRALDAVPPPAAAEALAARVHLGEVRQAQNRLDDAVAELEKALAIDPDNPKARAVLGEIAEAHGEHEKAVELLSAALASVPAATRLHYPLAMAQRALGDLDKAREHLERSGPVGLAVEDPLIARLQELATGERVYLLRGRQAFGAGRYGEAATEFRKAVAADPRSARVRVNLGSALGLMGDALGAIEQYEAALEIDPSNATAHFNLGLLRAQGGEDEQAVLHFQAAIDAKYDDSESHRQLGLALARLGRADAAVESLREAVAMDPRSENARLDHVTILVRLGRFQEALEELERAHALMPQAGAIAHALARLLAACPDPKLRDGARALDLAQRVYEAAPTPGHAATVSMALAELDRCAEAADWLGRIMAVAEEKGAGDWATAQRDTLARYQAGPPCR